MKLKSFIATISSSLALSASGLLVGFSLIELLVVVAIIGILAAIGTVGYNNYVIYTKNAVVLENANKIAEALKVCDAANDCPNFDPSQPGQAAWAAQIIAQNANMGNPISNLTGVDMITCYGSCGVDPSFGSPLGTIDVTVIQAPSNPSANAVQILACNYNGYNSSDPSTSTADPKSPAPFIVKNIL
jgi:type IV pilus assembly protein PilA